MASLSPVDASGSSHRPTAAVSNLRIGEGGVVMGGQFAVGESVWGQYIDPCGITFYKAKVLRCDEDGSCFLTWEGFGKEHDALTPANCTAKMNRKNNELVRAVAAAHDRRVAGAEREAKRAAARGRQKRDRTAATAVASASTAATVVRRERPAKRKREDSFLTAAADDSSDAAADSSDVDFAPAPAPTHAPPPAARSAAAASSSQGPAARKPNSRSKSRDARPPPSKRSRISSRKGEAAAPASSSSGSTAAAAGAARARKKAASKSSTKGGLASTLAARRLSQLQRGLPSAARPSSSSSSSGGAEAGPVQDHQRAAALAGLGSVADANESSDDDDVVEYLSLWPAPATVRINRDDILQRKKFYHILPTIPAQSVSSVMEQYCSWWRDKAHFHFPKELESSALLFQAGVLLKLNANLELYLAPHEVDQLRLLRRKNLIPGCSSSSCSTRTGDTDSPPAAAAAAAEQVAPLNLPREEQEEDLCGVYPVDLLLRFCTRLADALRRGRVAFEDAASREVVNLHLCLLPQFLGENAQEFQLKKTKFAKERFKSVSAPAAPAVAGWPGGPPRVAPAAAAATVRRQAGIPPPCVPRVRPAAGLSL